MVLRKTTAALDRYVLSNSILVLKRPRGSKGSSWAVYSPELTSTPGLCTTNVLNACLLQSNINRAVSLIIVAVIALTLLWRCRLKSRGHTPFLTHFKHIPTPLVADVQSNCWSRHGLHFLREHAHRATTLGSSYERSIAAPTEDPNSRTGGRWCCVSSWWTSSVLWSILSHNYRGTWSSFF